MSELVARLGKENQVQRREKQAKKGAFRKYLREVYEFYGQIYANELKRYEGR